MRGFREETTTMIKQLLAATAIVTIATAAQAAQPTTPSPATTSGSNAASTVLPSTGQIFLPSAIATDHLATKLIGASVYESDSPDAQSIGTVNDIVIAENGAVSAVVVGVGGFLGIGQKNVALDFTSLQWGNRDNTPVLVAAVSKDELNNAPGFDTAALDQANGQPVDQTAQAPANGMAPAGQTQPMDQTAQTNAPAAGAIAPTDQTAAGQLAANPPAPTDNSVAVPNASDLQSIDVATISAQELMNATVYGANNENVGEVGDVIVSQDGKIDAVILDVGGFLGLGEKPVAIGFDGLDIRKDANGALYVYTRFTKDQLEAAPQYDKNAYATSRDTMRLVAPM
jgi:sporulation protein YlmC with PRC-barrel domain